MLNESNLKLLSEDDVRRIFREEPRRMVDEAAADDPVTLADDAVY
jgi:hypothetical protein